MVGGRENFWPSVCDFWWERLADLPSINNFSFIVSTSQAAQSRLLLTAADGSSTTCANNVNLLQTFCSTNRLYKLPSLTIPRFQLTCIRTATGMTDLTTRVGNYPPPQNPSSAPDNQEASRCFQTVYNSGWEPAAVGTIPAYFFGLCTQLLWLLWPTRLTVDLDPLCWQFSSAVQR